ncbi:sulfotransferase family protein [Tropicibacter naphthalenivorans]|uniref:Branched-chain amino acid aminotransferase n=1 Tax=Tropicibacter naphthalenivorans TaxID=441103 RepID=A0A0P1GDF6_9RHOB|nr:sulfotransferase family protein [Tropicibacter naphthalenivorans]CUH79619.1 hypothetical protein TRN7648_02564 [Tropicibacter naphthalenivorans]SMC73790.1 hypothetical protein SAMN04488093_103193 [Tropicibacter naphthalenivorans]
MKIAMWSGPRNLSTAMMYSFGNRADMTCIDEPFYGPYLRLTKLQHPMAGEIKISRPQSAIEVEQSLLQPDPQHSYHKHMCQHMIDGIPRDFMADCVNVFLIRHPARVVASFIKGYPQATAEDIGFAAQAELYDHVCGLGQTPVVIDSADIRDNPEGMLRQLCAALDLPFDDAMLNWPAGPKPYDGVWAPHWYASVHASTGFAGPEGPLPELTGRALDLAFEAMPHYEKMAARKISPEAAPAS